jgi:ppGpp synthetase/RelA/SpoT-type nucleotidyltranferase
MGIVRSTPVVDVDARLVEIQIRTWLQHSWASATEKLAELDPQIKYGAGPKEIQQHLTRISSLIADFEMREVEYFRIGEVVENMGPEKEEFERGIAEIIEQEESQRL